MCKYCAYDDEMSTPKYGEYINSLPTVGKLEMGKLYIELKLNRYECNETKRNELILEISADTDSGYGTIDDEHIEIKYCPFCGEKL